MGITRTRKFLHWLPAILAVAMIAVESTALMSSDNTSSWLLPIWTHLFGPITPERWAIVHHYIRKTGHFTGYGLVSFCFFHAFRKSLHLAHRSLGALWVRASLYAIACTFLIASADEFHQSFLPSRTGSPFDVGIDTCGAITIQLLILALMPLFTRKSTLHPVPV